MRASLVYPYKGGIVVPKEMGTPREDQLQGTPLEQLTELSGRICYDSLGTGRSSFDQNGKQGYHTHIKEVNHTSVMGHAHITVNIETGVHKPEELGVVFLNRPGIFTHVHSRGVKVSLNLRAIYEWDSIPFTGSMLTRRSINIGNCLRLVGNLVAPNIIPPPTEPIPEIFIVSQERPLLPEEKYISLYLAGSRGFSHEQVRHMFRCGISQRSTRYCDESQSNWIEHPLVTAYLKENPSDLNEQTDSMINNSREIYVKWAETLEDWLLSKGLDKQTAKKQARGAARGYLGNALETEMIFTASVDQWWRMLTQRMSNSADAEIRSVYNAVLPALGDSDYGNEFSSLQTKVACDGLGYVLS